VLVKIARPGITIVYMVCGEGAREEFALAKVHSQTRLPFKRIVIHIDSCCRYTASIMASQPEAPAVADLNDAYGLTVDSFGTIDPDLYLMDPILK